MYEEDLNQRNCLSRQKVLN